MDIAEDVKGGEATASKMEVVRNVPAAGFVLPFHLKTDIYQFTAYFIRSAAEARAGGEKAVALYTEDALEAAILAEREACAKVAQDLYDAWNFGPYLPSPEVDNPPTAADAASAIRSGER